MDIHVRYTPEEKTLRLDAMNRALEAVVSDREMTVEDYHAAFDGLLVAYELALFAAIEQPSIDISANLFHIEALLTECARRGQNAEMAKAV